MKIPKIANAIEKIDDELIEKAETTIPKAKTNFIIKWVSLAACVALITIIAINLIPSPPSTNPTDKNEYERYKSYSIMSSDSAIIWPWKYLSTTEKYTELDLNGIKYITRSSAVSKSNIKDFIGTYHLTGYDEINDQIYTEDFDVYSLKYADKTQLVAVEMENKYYVFKNDVYSPPATLGELFNLVDFKSIVELKRFSENGDEPDKKHYELKDDDYVWEILKECKDAPFVEDDFWVAEERNHLSFSITSENLGVYKVGMYITEDGYLWTNAFSWQYLFNIGEDAAEKIIKYAKENSEKAEYEPYNKYIVGEITEITDEYFIVDDSVLCNNPEDGITYKILLNTIYISRYIDCGQVKLGDTVQIYTNADIDQSKENVITDATNINQVTIVDEELLVNE